MANFRPVRVQTLGVMRVFGLLSQTYNANILRSYQEERAGELIAHARRHVPFYADMLGDAATLSQAPIVDRTHLFDYASQFVAALLPRGQATIGLQYTPGTDSGLPVCVMHTNLTQDWQLALRIRDLEWAGIDPAEHLAVLKHGPTRELPVWSHELDDVCVTGRCTWLPNDQLSPFDQLSALHALSPRYLATHPSTLDLLLEVMGNNIPPSLTHVQLTGEPLTAQLRALASQQFAVSNTYACTELGYLASDCPLGKLHVHSESVALEILDPLGQPCSVGEVGRVVVTGLHNYATPLIRYALGDRAAWGPPCRCGLPHPVLERVEGREPPWFTGLDGIRRSSSRLVAELQRIGAARLWQLQELSPGRLVLRVIGSEWTPDCTRAFEQAVLRFYSSSAHSLSVEVCSRLPLHNGILRNVIACR